MLRAGEQLQPADAATTVRTRNGQTVLTDGPNADVVEHFGGFWIIEAPDLDAALKHARSCPTSDVGSVEVRGLVELGCRRGLSSLQAHALAASTATRAHCSLRDAPCRDPSCGHAERPLPLRGRAHEPSTEGR